MTQVKPDASVWVDFSLDLICPWCWIGLRNLLAAREALGLKFPGRHLAIHWHADTLLPQIPEQGLPYQAFYEARLGGPRAVEARRAQVRAAAEAAGLQLNHGAIQTFPNTRLVCALVNYAQQQLDGEAMIGFVESIFAAYFVQGRDIGSPMVLQQLAEAAKLNVDLASFDALRYQSAQGHVGGVPHMVFNQRLQVTGAVPPTELLRAMEHACAADTVLG
ncbi:MAG: DsbA family protein [Comamonas sp.]|jgi:predicted DsbA family dithiol-disulfide isomerase|uniref:DsbA family protein n=1 Tax=Comamonas sp. TaxID=34028 RepID=UPI002818B11E|nr:DsbA family protein [Comamonas sp.]MDR0215204.1 DsbA family protein [Comamonas sp.]